MYRIRVITDGVRDALGNPYAVAQADVIVKNRFATDQWQVHAKCPQRAWERFDLKWQPGPDNLLRLVAGVAMHMGRFDEYTLREALRQRSAYQPGCVLTVLEGDRKLETVATLEIARLADYRHTYHALWHAHGDLKPLARTINYGPERFDLWALLMRASALLAIRKYAPRVGMAVCHV